MAISEKKFYDLSYINISMSYHWPWGKRLSLELEKHLYSNPGLAIKSNGIPAKLYSFSVLFSSFINGDKKTFIIGFFLQMKKKEQ